MFTFVETSLHEGKDLKTYEKLYKYKCWHRDRQKLTWSTEQRKTMTLHTCSITQEMEKANIEHVLKNGMPQYELLQNVWRNVSGFTFCIMRLENRVQELRLWSKQKNNT